MVVRCPSALVNKHARSVISQRISNGYLTGYGSSLIYFIYHLFFSIQSAKFLNRVYFGIFLSPAFTSHTILALNLSRALQPIIMSKSLIRRTGLISDVMLVDPHIGISGVTSVAAAVEFVAGKKNLGGDVDIGPLGFSHDFYAVADGGSSCEGPARSAVTGADLVFLEG